MTGWLCAVGLDVVKAAVLLKAAVAAGASSAATLVMQTASVRTDNPDSWATVNPGQPLTQTGAGETSSANLTISSATASKMWIRFGLAYGLTAGSTAPAEADATLALLYAACGSVLGSWHGQLATNATGDSFVALTPMIPAILADKIKAALIVTSGGATFRCRIVVRYAATTPDGAAAWTDTADSNTADNGERNTGELTLTTSTNLYVQVGLAYSSTNGALARADIAVAVGARRTA